MKNKKEVLLDAKKKKKDRSNQQKIKKIKNPEHVLFGSFFQNHEFTKLRPKKNHEIARITNCEITKFEDPLYLTF